jgi:non-homologous end joining protein Ku
MASRALWNGQLPLSLVSIPLEVFSATSGRKADTAPFDATMSALKNSRKGGGGKPPA